MDAVIVPVGGGGLISGIAFVLKSLNPNIKVYGVEAAGAASMLASRQKGSVDTLPSVSTMADGIAVKRPGDLTYQLCQDYVDEIVTLYFIRNWFQRSHLRPLTELAGHAHLDAPQGFIACLVKGQIAAQGDAAALLDDGFHLVLTIDPLPQNVILEVFLFPQDVVPDAAGVGQDIVHSKQFQIRRFHHHSVGTDDPRIKVPRFTNLLSHHQRLMDRLITDAMDVM